MLLSLGLRRWLLLGLFLSIILFSALLYWKLIDYAHETKLSVMNQPPLMAESSTNVEVEEEKETELEEEDSCVTASSLWRLPASHFQYISWKQKLIAANHAMHLLSEPFDKTLRNYVRALTNTTICLKGVVRYEDIFEIVRYRYAPRSELNQNISSLELEREANMLNAWKGDEITYHFNHTEEITDGSYFQYRHDYHDLCFLRKISMKYNASCPPDNILEQRYQRKLLIVAVQRSGTHFMWEMLNRLGLDLHHEGVGPEGAVSWLYAVNAQSKTFKLYSEAITLQLGYVINNPQKLTGHRFDYVFHQVRHPLRVISTLVSRCSKWDRYWKWITRMSVFDIITPYHSPLKRAMLLYLLWNRHMELYSDIRYRVEVTSARDICQWAQFNSSYCSSPYRAVVNNHNASKSSSQLFSDPALTNETIIKSIVDEVKFANFRNSLLEEQPPRRRKLSSMRHYPAIPDYHHIVEDREKMAKFLYPAGNRHKFNQAHLNNLFNPTSIKKTEHKRIDLNWSDLDREDLILSNELKIMCIEYGFPLDYQMMPQRNDTYSFTA